MGRGGSLPLNLTDQERIERASRVNDATGCREWVQHLTPNGYGQLNIRGRNRLAHALAWETARGPVPSGLVLDHLCRNKKCCNVDHLEPVTDRENILRGTGPSAVNAAKTHCDKGHPLSGDNLRILGGRSQPQRRCRECNRLGMVRWRAKKVAADVEVICGGVI
jgi:hypothetical protein